MTDFDKIMVRYSLQAPTLGPSTSFPAPELRKDLLMLIRSNGRYFVILFGLLVALLILVIVLVALSVREPQKAVALLVGSTAVTFFLFRTMLRAWEVKSKSDALLVLASSLDEKVLRSVVLALSQPPRDAKKD